MARIVHLVPFDGIGGVEVAAKTMARVNKDGIEFEVIYLFPNYGRMEKVGPLQRLLDGLKTCWKITRDKNDVLIVSLWRSALAGIFIKLLKRNMKLVLFLHSTGDSNRFDNVTTRLAVLLADQVWADSEATLTTRVPGAARKGRIISYLPRRLVPTLMRSEASPTFISWGRLAPVKALDRSIRLFVEIHKLYPEATYTIIGPDGGEQERLQALSENLGVSGVIKFAGAKSIDEIAQLACDATFFLQSSIYEGMGLSVIEAMQLGLIPIVTPVGEIRAYCRDGYNAVLIESDRRVIEDVHILIASPERYVAMRDSAVIAWKDKKLYSESVLEACYELSSLK